ncbi:hypothetical protein BCR32DRAFT_325101 [Anaeromyces robustus]|uniref:Ankyrin n=1 Tax=Anaeromyces robustus TaxID=1754192 RepID=A0A1Y1XL77_9FUNG|nr:hypothetical protein BCR32DRAFT_325101 [Anaeromyces robustus]|eukprot:ORX86226.1 hypothetical protein BCR32DRAFT_325101 [Anaeromyces robustus]
MNTVREENNNYTTEFFKKVYVKLENYIKENEIIKDNVIHLFTSMDIRTELEDYLFKYNISLKELNKIVNEIKKYILCLSIEYSKIYNSQLKMKDTIFQTNLSYIEYYIEDKKKTIYNTVIEIMKRDDLLEFKDYIYKHDLSLNDLNTDHYDLLIWAIENNISQEIIDIILLYYPSLNYYIFDIEEGDEVEKSPLSSAIAEDNFKLADILIKNKADINYKLFLNDIIKNLTVNKLLDDKNLRYILSNGFSLTYINNESSFIEDLIKASYPSYFIEIVFKFYIFDINFILNFLHYSKNKKGISTVQFNNIIKQEKCKIHIKDKWYSTAIKYGAFDAIDIFIEYDIRKEEAILNLIKKKKV